VDELNDREKATQALQALLQQIDAGDVKATDVERAHIAGAIEALENLPLLGDTS